MTELERLREEKALLRAVLEPFAKAADNWIEMGATRPVDSDGAITVGDLRLAKSALRSTA